MVTQRRPWRDDATENRTLPFDCEGSQKQLPTVELDDWVEEGIEVQNELLWLRLMYWDKVVIDKSERIKNVIDHRLTASILPLRALSKFAPSMVEVEKLLLDFEKRRKSIRAMSKDGVVLNILWDYLEKNFFDRHEQWCFVGKERGIGDQKETVFPLTTKDISDQLGTTSSSDIRRTLHSLQLCGDVDDEPPRVKKVNGASFRPIWFTPARLLTRMTDFVAEDSIDKKMIALGLLPDPSQMNEGEQRGKL